jgi:hypothetical protein
VKGYANALAPASGGTAHAKPEGRHGSRHEGRGAKE